MFLLSWFTIIDSYPKLANWWQNYVLIGIKISANFESRLRGEHSAFSIDGHMEMRHIIYQNK